MTAAKIRSLVFDAFMACVVATFFILSLSYSPKARFVPLMIATPVLCLAVFRLVADVVKLVKEHGGSSKAEEPDESEKGKMRKELAALGWIFLLLVLVWLVGFIITIPVYMFLALRIRAKESWKLTAALSLGTWAFMYILFVMVLNIQFSYGFLVDLILQ